MTQGNGGGLPTNQQHYRATLSPYSCPACGEKAIVRRENYDVLPQRVVPARTPGGQSQIDAQLRGTTAFDRCLWCSWAVKLVQHEGVWRMLNADGELMPLEEQAQLVGGEGGADGS